MKAASEAEVGEIEAEEKWVRLDGIRMRYLQCGSGPSLVLLHGLLGYSFSWRFVAPVLGRQATVFAVDMPGAGFSDRPENLDCCLRACAGRLLRFFDAAGIASCDLVGTSHGGGVAMIAASLAPHRIRRLILVAPINPWSSLRKQLAALLGNPLVAPILLALAPHCEVFYEAFLRRLYGDTQRIPPGTLEGYVRPLRIPGALRYGLGVLRSWKQDLEQLGNILPQIAHIPALLIWGSLDRAVDPGSAEYLKHQFKDCRLVMFDGVGHLPYEEAPDEFNRVMAQFLESSCSVAQPRVPSS
jgi:pimeloyl-ACP methyl ester carboxylesterase